MLGELYRLHQTLVARGLDVPLVHRDFDTPNTKSRPTFVVKLDSGGRLKRLTPLLPEQEGGVWTLKSGNHGYFPAVRTEREPLLVLAPGDPAWVEVERFGRLSAADRMRCLRRLCAAAINSGPTIDLPAVEKQALRIASWPTGPDDDLTRHLQQLAHASRRFAAAPKRAAIAMLVAIGRAARSGIAPGTLDQLVTFVVGHRKKPKGRAGGLPQVEHVGAQLMFDLWDPDDPAFSIYGLRMRQHVLHSLHGEAVPNALENVGFCALSLRSLPLLRAPFPGWSAKPAISKSLRPFDKFSEASCNLRYGRADAEGFDIGEDVANSIVGALSLVTDASKLGKTWRPLKNGIVQNSGQRTLEQSDVLVTFPSCAIDVQTETGSPVNPPDTMVEPLAEEDDGGDLRRKVFEDAAQPVCEAFEMAIRREQVQPHLQILLIRQVSSGQIQMAYSARPSFRQMIDAIEHWTRAGKNLPLNLRVPLPVKAPGAGHARHVLVRPRTIFPEQVARILAREWIRNGSASTVVPTPRVGMVLELFLQRPGALPDAAMTLLDLSLARGTALLSGLGAAIHGATIDSWMAEAAQHGGSTNPCYASAHHLSLIGSLLFMLNSTAGEYSQSRPFLVGKVLAMLDELHRHYCVAARDGDIPPTLIGNSVLGRASDNPADAFAELLERSRPYLAWARTAQPPPPTVPRGSAIRNAVFRARDLLAHAQPLCDQLGIDSALAKPMTTIDKAHLLLGYLSSTSGPNASALEEAPNSNEEGNS
ncbi:MAG: hypothetical protein U1E72_08045 [Burkholderiaceae bacterium]